MREVLLTTAFFAVGIPLCVVIVLLLGRVVGAIAGIRCPRCRGRVSWTSSHWPSGNGWRPVHLCFCFRCRALMRLTKTGDGWSELRRLW